MCCVHTYQTTYKNGNPQSNHGDGAHVSRERNRAGETLRDALPPGFLQQVTVYSFFICQRPCLNWKIGKERCK